MLNMVANPSFSLADFNSVGVTADNTYLKSPEYYKNNPFIQQKYTKDDGRFDDKRFNQDYQSAQLGFQLLKSDQANQAVQRQIEYAASNISAPVQKKRTLRDMYKVHTVANPTKQSYSMIGRNQQSKLTMSMDELAQQSKVLLNPLTAGDDLSNAQWGDNPHNGFFDYWNKTLVLATWDEDGEHRDPLTGQMMHHQKGEQKLNQDGQYYYETLDGRTPYGKKVLNKMNVLTEEGSFWNKLDFLDSDDISKSAGGTIMKNLALVGSMFIPYVGPAVTAVSLIPQLAGLVGTLGKMASGSDNDFFSELEGFRKSWELQGNVSEEAQQHPWNLENWINLVGDTVAQLRQQRFIFEKIPAIFKGKYYASEESLKAEFAKEAEKFYGSKLSELEAAVKANPEQYYLKWADLARSKDALISLKSAAEAQSFIKGYNKIGEILSKGYMTGITVMDTYGEAKEAGASDIEATLLTLGHGAAEAWILNTAIGEWVLPELHNERLANRTAVRKFMEGFKNGNEEALGTKGKSLIEAFKGNKTDKKLWAQKIIRTAKDFFKGEYFVNGSKAGGIAATTLAGALGEGVEEVSEELIADTVKGLYNTVQWLQGDDSRMNSFGYTWQDGQREWDSDDFFTRYGMSFFGGMLGGGINNLGTSYKITKDLGKMDKRGAWNHIVYSIRNGESEGILKALDEYQVGGSDDLAATPTINADGTKDWTVKGNNSQNYQAKKMIRQIFNFAQDTLNASGTNLTDVEFLDKQMLGEWRYQMLANSQTAIDYLNDFNKLNVDLIQLKSDLMAEENKLQDLNKDGVTTDPEKRASGDKINNTIKDIQEKIKITEDKLKAYLNGDYSHQFMAQAFLEMSNYMNHDLGIVPFPIFVKQKYGKNFDDLSPELQEKAQEEFKKYKQDPENRDRLKYAAQMLLEMEQLLAPDLANMALDVNTEAYNKAKFAFQRMIATRAALADQDIFLATVNDSKDKRMLRIMQIMNPDLVKQTYSDSLFLTPEAYKNLVNPSDTEYNDYVQKWEAQKQADEQARNAKVQSINASLDTVEQGLNNELARIDQEYTDAVAKLDKDIQDLKDQITTLEQEKSDLETKRQSQSGVEKSKTTRRLNKIPGEIDALQQQVNAKEASKENNIKLAEAKRDQAKLNQQAIYQNNIKPLLEQRNKTINDFNQQLAKDLQNQQNSFINEININIVDELQGYLQAFVDKGYLEPGMRQEIEDVLELLATDLDRLNQLDILQDTSKIDQVLDLKKAVIGELDQNGNRQGGLGESKLESLINKFAITTGQTPFNYSELLNKIYAQFSAANGSQDIKATKELDEAITNAALVLRMLKLALKGATTDTLSIAQGHPFGFNAMLNAISEKQGRPLNLALLSSDDTLPIIEQIQNMENQLLYVKRLYEHNKGNKFNQQDTAYRSQIRNRYNALKKFFLNNTNPFKDWDDFNTLEAAIHEIETDDVINQDIKELETKKAKLELAIYNFGQKNIAKLKDVNEMAKVMDMFDFLDNTKNNTELSSDQEIAHYLMSCLTLNSTDFYHQVSQLNFGNVAPIPMQVEHARMVYAKLMNEDLFRVYFDAIELNVRQKVKNMDSATFKEVLIKNIGVADKYLIKEENKEVWHTGLNYPKHANFSLVTGGAGTGKTSGVFDIIRRLTADNQTISSNIYFAHGAKEKSADVQVIGDKIFGAGSSKGFSKNDLLNHFINDFKGLKETDTGFEVLPGTTKFDTEKGAITTQTINKSADVPSILFIDEISLFSEYDIQSLQQWAEENGFHIIAAGDYRQNTLEADQSIILPSGDTAIFGISSNPANFYGAPRLSISMRTDNSVKTSNQQIFETFLEATEEYSEKIKVEFVKKGKQLFGDRVASNMDIALQEIKDMIETLETGERITYIYDSENSELYKTLHLPENKNIADFIDFRQGSKAQGDETRYSIVDLSNLYSDVEEKQTASRYIYTGITRARQGSLVFIPSNNLFTPSENVPPNTIDIYSNQIDDMYSESGYEEYLQNFTKDRLDLLKEIYPSGEEIKYNKPTKRTQTQSNPIQPTNPQQQQQSQQQNQQQPSQNQPQQPQQPQNQPQQRRRTSQPRQNTQPQGNNQPQGTNGSGTTNGPTQTTDPLTQLVDYINQQTGSNIREQSLANLNQDAIRNTRDQLSQGLINEGFTDISALKDYEYYGIDTVADLIRLLNGDDSGIVRTNDLSEPHRFYVTAADLRNPLSVGTIYADFQDPNVQVLEGFISVNYPGINYLDISELASNISIIEFEKATTFINNNTEPIDTIQEDILDDEEIDKANDTTKKVDHSKKPIRNKTYLNSMDFDINFFTLNTLELGAIENSDGQTYSFDQHGNYVDQRTGKQTSRIDSINGLHKIYQEFKKGNPAFKNIRPEIIELFEGPKKQHIKPALVTLAGLQNVCLLGKNKTEIIQKLERRLGLSDLFVNFGIRAIPPRSQVKNNPSSDSTVNTQEHKDVNEKVYGFNNKVENEDQVGSLQLVAFIGKQKYGEFLEIPLFSLSNPITLILSTKLDANGNEIYNFPEAAKIYNQFVDKPIEGLKEIAKMDSDLGKYCRLYLRGNHFIYKFGIVTLDANNRYFNESAVMDQWVPSMLMDGRLEFSQQKGVYQADTDQLIYEASSDPTEWKNLADFMGIDPTDRDQLTRDFNPRLKYTNVLRVPKTGKLENGNKTVELNPGHNFILAVQSDTYLTQKQIIEKYIEEQNNPNLPKTVQLIYVIPPAATIGEYLQYLQEALKGNGKRFTYQIGLKNTTHKLLSLIMNDGSLVSLLDNLDLAVAGNTTNKQAFIQQLQNLDRLYEQFMRTGEESDKKAYYDAFEKEVQGKPGVKLKEFLNSSFVRLFTNRDSSINQDKVTALQNALDTRNAQLQSQKKKPILLRYTPKIDQNVQEIYGAHQLLGVKDGKLSVGGNLLDFKVRGKLDTIQYTGKLPMFQQLMQFVRLNHEGDQYLFQASQYADYDADVNDPNRRHPAGSTSNTINVQQTIDSVLSGTGITYTATDNNPSSAFPKFVRDINSRNDNPYFAYMINGKIEIKELSVKTNKSIELLNMNDRPITKVIDGTNFKIKFTDNNGNIEIYIGQIDNGNFGYWQETNPEPPIQIVTEQDVVNLWNTVESKQVPFTKGVHPKKVVTSYKNTTINQLIRDKVESPIRVQALNSIDPSTLSPEQQEWVNALLQVEDMIQKLDKDPSCNITLR